MRQLTIKVPFKEGLHARPASELVKVCQTIESDIVLSKGDREVDPKSILGIMSLGASYEDEIIFKVTGEDEDKAIEALEDYFSKSI